MKKSVDKMKMADVDEDPELDRQASDIVNQAIKKALAKHTQ